MFVADIRSEQAQRFDHAGAVEHQSFGGRGAHAGCAGQVVDAVIQQRAADPLQQLRRRFEREQGGRRQMPTGRFTDDNHGQPGKFAIVQDAVSGAQTVFQQALDRRRHGQPIINRHHRHVAGVDDGDVEVVVHLRIADHPAATMEIQHHASGFALGADDAHGHRVDDLAFGAQPMLAQLASAAELTRPQQRLNQPWGEAIANLETRQPGELFVERANLRQFALALRPWKVAHRRFFIRIEAFSAAATHSHARYGNRINPVTTSSCSASTTITATTTHSTARITSAAST